MRSAISTPASHLRAHRRAGPLLVAPLAAAAWVAVALLGFAVRLALFPKHRTPGATSALWGVAFALFLWAGARSVGLHDPNAVLFALVAGGAITVFVYLRGAGLERPPLEQPGAFFRRRLAARGAPRPARPARRSYTGQTRELSQARSALTRGDLGSALFSLREAERVAVAQARPEELREVLELARRLSAASSGRTRAAGERLAEDAERSLRPPAVRPRTRTELRALAAAEAQGSTIRELAEARRSLDQGDLETALFDLREARRVAVAQRRLRELLEVADLAALLASRSAGRRRAASERLAADVDYDLQSF
jgi:hypothetical protein